MDICDALDGAARMASFSSPSERKLKHKREKLIAIFTTNQVLIWKLKLNDYRFI